MADNSPPRGRHGNKRNLGNAVNGNKDVQPAAPAVQLTCTICHQQGHDADHCWRTQRREALNRRQIDNAPVQQQQQPPPPVQQASPAGQVTCQVCNEHGHTAKQCWKSQRREAVNRTHGPVQQQQAPRNNTPPNQQHVPVQNAPPLTCVYHPHSTNHTTENCKKRPRNASTSPSPSPPTNNSNNVTHPQTSNVQKRNASPTLAHVHVKPLTDWQSGNSTELVYCEGCNKVGHTDDECSNPLGPGNRQRSKWVCTLCNIRGHTADECHNPNPSNCAICRYAGHSAKNCRLDETHSMRYLHTAKVAAEPVRFKWDLENMRHPRVFGPGQRGCLMLAKAQKSNIVYGDLAVEDAERAIATQESTLANWGVAEADKGNPPFEMDATPEGKGECPMTDTEQAAYQRGLEGFEKIVKHVQNSRNLYRKHNANAGFIRHEKTIVASNMLSTETIVAIAKSIHADDQFWRDPEAMCALADRKKPKCDSCGCEGSFHDGYMKRLGPETNVLEVRDGLSWGLFVHFGCKCCNDGFKYV